MIQGIKISELDASTALQEMALDSSVPVAGNGRTVRIPVGSMANNNVLLMPHPSQPDFALSGDIGGVVATAYTMNERGMLITDLKGRLGMLSPNPNPVGGVIVAITLIVSPNALP